MELRSSQLKEGQRAEVIVVVEEAASISSKLAALETLQKSLKLTERSAQDWIAQARHERESLGPNE